MEVITTDVQEIGVNATDAQRATFREQKKKDWKATFLIHQSIDEVKFDRISTCTSAKIAWETLEKYHAGNKKVKKVKLQALRKQCELLVMEEHEKVGDFINKIRSITKFYGTERWQWLINIKVHVWCQSQSYIKVPLSKNKTFQININIAEVRCLKAIESMNKFGYGMQD